MALLLSKRLHVRRGYSIAAIWTIGILTLVTVPFSQAITVKSPSKSMVTHVYTPPSLDATPVAQSTSKASLSKPQPTPAPQIQSSTDCKTDTPMRSKLLKSFSLHLKKLAEYEQVCTSAVINKMSFFVATPTTIDQAQEYATDVAYTLREFAKYDVSPVVFMEPTANDGLVDLVRYQAGDYDVALDTYFLTLASLGITDTMMGTWVPIPEGNIPVWTSVNPAIFTSCVTKAVSYQKKYFPTSKSSILLDNQTYPSADSWEGGQVISFTPYVQNIPAGLIDSFGLQGFPWSPPANEGGPDIEQPQDYLRVDLAAQAARTLGVNDVWFNTGTFSKKYAGQTKKQVTQTPEQRSAALAVVVSQVSSLSQQGFSPSIHLFAEDKSRVDEATNWSYWSSNTVNTSPSTSVFKTFMHNTQTAGIPVWLFDTK